MVRAQRSREPVRRAHRRGAALTRAHFRLPLGAAAPEAHRARAAAAAAAAWPVARQRRAPRHGLSHHRLRPPEVAVARAQEAQGRDAAQPTACAGVDHGSTVVVICQRHVGETLAQLLNLRRLLPHLRHTQNTPRPFESTSQRTANALAGASVFYLVQGASI